MNRSVPESLLICILVLCLALTPVGVRGETEDSGKAQQRSKRRVQSLGKETGTVTIPEILTPKKPGQYYKDHDIDPYF